MYIMMQSPFIDFLAQRLTNTDHTPLPGYAGQQRMAPFQQEIYEPPTDITAYKHSAVLALLVQRTDADDLEFLFTLRSSDLKNHSGQISFAGGRSEGTETVIETALRETWEEIGVPAEQIRILGGITPLYVPVSQSMIHPIVGFHVGEPMMHLNPDEVEEVFFVPITEFLKPERIDRKPWTVLGREVMVPYWNVHPVVLLWGATAMMVAEILTLYEEFLQVR
jgi:8-oxo-dGTP pyrophosphatase MutT (NUDIX family)